VYQNETASILEKSLSLCLFHPVVPLWGLSLGIQVGVVIGRTNPWHLRSSLRFSLVFCLAPYGYGVALSLLCIIPLCCVLFNVAFHGSGGNSTIDWSSFRVQSQGETMEPSLNGIQKILHRLEEFS
jgi:hypothetical protein